jgi:predicted small integral membrane protein
MAQGVRDGVRLFLTVLIAVAFIALLHSLTGGEFVLWRAVLVSVVIICGFELVRSLLRRRRVQR